MSITLKKELAAAKALNSNGYMHETYSESVELLGLPIDEFFNRLNTSPSGLTSSEAENRLKIYGHNEITGKKRRTAVIEFFFHLLNPLIFILLLAGFISGLLGDLTEATIILLIVVVSEVLDVYQETRAERAAELLKEKVTTTATVLRDGVKQEIKFSELVPGDIVYLSAGAMSPADARVMDAKDLFIDQSALTGESFPVEKIITPLKKKEVAITEWDNCLFLGTSVVSGTTTAAVIETGGSTEFGKIAQKLAAREPTTEFERGLRRFGYLMMQLTFVLVIFVFFINALFKHNILESMLFS